MIHPPRACVWTSVLAKLSKPTLIFSDLSIQKHTHPLSFVELCACSSLVTMTTALYVRVVRWTCCFSMFDKCDKACVFRVCVLHFCTMSLMATRRSLPIKDPVKSLNMFLCCMRMKQLLDPGSQRSWLCGSLVLVHAASFPNRSVSDFVNVLSFYHE